MLEQERIGGSRAVADGDETQMSSGRGEWGEKVGEGSVCMETRRGTERQIDRLQSTRWEEGLDGKKLNGDDKAGCRWRGLAQVAAKVYKARAQATITLLTFFRSSYSLRAGIATLTSTYLTICTICARTPLTSIDEALPHCPPWTARNQNRHGSECRAMRCWRGIWTGLDTTHDDSDVRRRAAGLTKTLSRSGALLPLNFDPGWSWPLPLLFLVSCEWTGMEQIRGHPDTV